jgi:ABC-2 type transport system permease protein
VAVILILSMSALGGSMVPRYVMSETMRQVGKITFNAWALDGYIKVFWRDLRLLDLAPELTVLATTAVVLFGVARYLGRRWEGA